MNEEEVRADLQSALQAATGSDKDLDKRVSRFFGDSSSRAYTSSVDDCLALIGHAAPGWSWHVGWSSDGTLPYASLHLEHDLRIASGPTVPLALLRALIKIGSEEEEVDLHSLPQPPPWMKR